MKGAREMLTKGQLIADRYEIIDEVGTGGMAVVYKAKDLRLDRDVALKVLKREFAEDEEMTRRFSFGAEAQNVAALNHTNIVNVYDMDDNDPIHYIVMEFVDGKTLKTFITEEAPLDNLQIISAIKQIAEALAHAHEHKIIHRDIKPQNILVTNEGIIKVADFGIARSARSDTIEFNRSTMCSAHYASPEQVRTGVTDGRSDLYSLGILMYELATGDLPFNGDDLLAITYKHQHEPLPDVFESAPALYPALGDIIVKLTQKDPIHRYQNADQLIDDLDEAFDNPIYSVRPEIDLHGDTKTVAITKVNPRQATKVERNTNAYDNGSSNRGSGGSGRRRNDYYDDYDRKQMKKEKLAIAGAILLAIVLLAVLAVVVLPRILRSDSRPEVPDVRGWTVEAALAEFERLGIPPFDVYDEWLFNDEFEYGQIIDFSHAIIGRRWDERWEDELNIFVRVSRGSETVEVPTLTGMTFTQAHALATGHGFTVTEEQMYSDNVPQHHIISQNPAAGESVAPGGSIHLVVSTGQSVDRVTVPLVIGLTESQGRSVLEQNGLNVGPTRLEYHEYLLSGTIIRQSQDAGTEVSRGSMILIDVSQGPAPATPVPTAPPDEPEPTPPPELDPDPTPPPTPPPATPSPYANVPNVVGLTEEQGRFALEQYGFVVGEVRREYHAYIPPYNIIGQSHNAGTEVLHGTSITIDVSRGPLPTPPPTLPPEPPTPPPLPVFQNIVVSLMVETEEDEVNVVIYNITNPNARERIFDVVHPVAQFPFNWLTEGVGIMELAIYQNGELVDIVTLNFNDD